MKKAKRAILWFRNDLRLHDNEALSEALKTAEEIYPVYIFDERTFFGKTSTYGFKKTGNYRAKFILESVLDLKNSLKIKGIDLIVRIGKPEEEVFKLANEIKSSFVCCNKERMPEESAVQDKLEQNLWSVGQELKYFRGKMLYYTQDLPFPVAHTPEIFTTFRKEVEKITPIRSPIASPANFKEWSFKVDCGTIPELSDLGYEPFENDERTAFPFKGGETEALKRLNFYFWESNLIKTYEETRNDLSGSDYSTKFSPWLATGCLSPKQIYSELTRYEKERGANKSTYWLYFELLWRDYFRLIGKKYGARIFQKNGLLDKTVKLTNDDAAKFNSWKTGKTGDTFIDANMKELNLTGFMSNRGRQNVASYLVNDLKVNWQMGAEYFESMLIDYDVTSNWCNWLYIAGQGNDPREDRYFNPLIQARKYDSKAVFAKRWFPELVNKMTEEIYYSENQSEKQNIIHS